MVCVEPEEALCVIVDPRPDAQQKKFIVKLRNHNTVDDLYEHVGLNTLYLDFELLFPAKDNNVSELTLHDKKQRKITDVGIELGKRTILHIHPKAEDYSAAAITVQTDMASDDGFDLGASASPVESSNQNMPAPPPLPGPLFYEITGTADPNATSLSRLRRCTDEYSQPTSNNYRGLVNQAMTCYLNSLLQALFMTPEFRNALYKWEFDGNGEAKSIPYQLQKLFVNLQTSPKSSVETTDLTRSFGWDSAEGWQQHDIQELCRVMFDALEQKFKNTKQADLINRLYEGKMIDYVKCLDCNTEKQREDKFLDIPLPVRPFGSAVAYENIEDALRAFVQPEILEGNNQYHCETCNKKCDAHKGLKFTKFPYILTLHLKRFDFDYQTFHRIKLNDKVTFPQTLNLNNFVNNTAVGVDKSTSANGAEAAAATTMNGTGSVPSAMPMETAENFMKTYDECSTTDSGSALEEDSAFQNGTSVSSTTTTPNDQFMTQEDDEGIDMELNGDSKSPSVSNFNAPGPYVYELFAIMIHSGSASGGHYYAYIKDFNSSKWFSFNDQTVSSITQDDIQKSFGGGASKSYYSGAYSSSTNAYMLMYRQIDSSKNASPIKEEEFPEHIKELVIKIRDSDGCRSKADSDAVTVKVFFDNPRTRAIKSYKMYLLNDSTLSEALEEAYRVLHVKGIVPMERCRLVGYDRHTECIEKSFEGQEEEKIEEIMRQLKRSSELLLETREEHEVFEPYLQNGVMTKVYRVDVANRDVDGPYSIRVNKTQNVLDFKQILARKFRLHEKSLVLALNEYNNGGNGKILSNNDATIKEEGMIEYTKVFVAVHSPNDPEFENKFKQFVSRLDHLIGIYFILPNMEPETLKKLSIPPYVPKVLPPQVNGNATDVHMANTDSNSEDSSLSDNDRTLVEDDVHTQLNGDVSNLHFSNGVSSTNHNIFKDADDDDEEESYLAECRNNDYYFKVAPLVYQSSNNDAGAQEESTSSSSSSSDTEKVIKVLIDKRANHGYLKYRLQSYLKVPMEYFKLFKNSTVNQQEITLLKEELNAYNDGDRLTIELGRVLRKGEYKINLHYFNVNDIVDDLDKLPFLCNWIVRNGQEVGQIKRDVLAHLAASDSKYNHLTYDRCRLRKKCWKSISKVYTDEQKVGEEVAITNSSDMILQEVEDLPSVTPTHYNDVVLLIRRWHPSEMKLGKMQEVLFANKCELKNLLSKISEIPEDNIEYVKIQSRDSVSVLQIHSLQWMSTPNRSDDYNSTSFQDGNVLYYRDKTEPLAELTAEERKELTKKDIRSSSTYSPRKERALKIYVDASPKKADD